MWLGAFAGLWLAEACGLQVTDVDFMRGVVSPAVQYPAEPPKNLAGVGGVQYAVIKLVMHERDRQQAGALLGICLSSSFWMSSKRNRPSYSWTSLLDHGLHAAREIGIFARRQVGADYSPRTSAERLHVSLSPLTPPRPTDN